MSETKEITCINCGDLFVPDWEDKNEPRERCRFCEELLGIEKDNEG